LLTSAQMRAARALLGIDQKQMAELSGVSVPTIQRMEASEGNVRGVIDTLIKVVEAFERAGIELIGENATSSGGGITFLGRPRSEAARAAHEVDRFSLAAMATAAALCILIGIFPGPVIDLAGRAVAEVNGGVTPPVQGGQGWLSLVPIDATHSSYNGLILLVFIALSATMMAVLVHRLGSRAVRWSPAWDCGYPDPSPQTQYSASGFAQPLRRVFGEILFRARDEVDMPGPGEVRPARLTVSWHDLVWELLYRPVAGVVELVADRLNVLQYLTVRRYLTMMFGALVTLLGVVALWR
jgi:hydrogenase-4 component B